MTSVVRNPGDPTAYYEALGDGRFLATQATVGPWDPRLQHGSPPAALLVHVLERAHPRPDMRLAQVSYDFFGPVAVGELAVSTEIVRPGARVELLRATLRAGGRVAMTASAWRMATAEGRAPMVPDERPAPPLPGAPAQPGFASMAPFGDHLAPFGYGESLEGRFVSGSFATLGPAVLYARPRVPLLAGEPLSPIERLLLLVDSANGISAPLPPMRFMFVPVALSVSVRRHPRGEWVGLDAKTTVEPDGVGHTQAELFDEQGYLGSAMQTLFVAPTAAAR